MGNSEASEITAFTNHLSLCEPFGFRAVDLEVMYSFNFIHWKMLLSSLWSYVKCVKNLFWYFGDLTVIRWQKFWNWVSNQEQLRAWQLRAITILGTINWTWHILCKVVRNETERLVKQQFYACVLAGELTGSFQSDSVLLWGGSTRSNWPVSWRQTWRW